MVGANLPPHPPSEIGLREKKRMEEGYSRSGQQATMKDVQEWLIEGQEMLVSSDEAFVQKMEALNAKKCQLVEDQQAREKKLKFVKDNLVMLENVRREKKMEVMKLHRVFVSLPKNFLEVAATRVKNKVFPAGDHQMWQPSIHSTPIKVQYLEPQSMKSGPAVGDVRQVLAVDFSFLRLF